MEDAPTEYCSLHGPEIESELGEAGGLALTGYDVPVDVLAWVETDLAPHRRRVEGVLFDKREAASQAPVGPTVRPQSVEDATVLRLLEPPANGMYSLVPDIPSSLQRLEIVGSVSPSAKRGEVRLLVNGSPWHVWPGPPYRVLWPISVGAFEFTLEAQATSGRSAQSSVVRITVTSSETP